MLLGGGDRMALAPVSLDPVSLDPVWPNGRNRSGERGEGYVVRGLDGWSERERGEEVG
jgi:hypothetical protein